MWDVDGREYIDFCMSFGPLILGHRDPDVAEAVARGMQHTWTLGACEPYSLELAEFVCARTPAVEKIRFVSSGTEAVMSALRIARAATGRNKVLKFDGCYHGHTDALLVKAGSGLAGETSSDSAGVGRELVQNTLVLPLDDEAAVEDVFQRHGEEIAVLALEPLPANYGLLPQREEYLRRIVEIARSHGALVLFDEVISGFRVGMQGMAGALNIKPDLITFGKILGGGFPVGAYAGRAELLDLVAPLGPVYQAGTLSAHPIGMVAGLATLKKCAGQDFYLQLAERTKHFAFRFQEILNRHSGEQWELCHQASLFWIRKQTDAPVRTVSAIPSGHKEGFARLFHRLLDRGVYLAPSGYEVGFLSAAHSAATLDEALNRIEDAVKAGS